jgi:DNA invertase Pin-like site-specific DNA recombinase
MIKAYSYIRFSTPEQAQGDSFRRQTSMAAEYVKRHALTLDTELKLTDLGVSAFRGSNELAALGGFKQAIADGIVSKGSVLLVEALDRISRKEARLAVRVLEDIVDSGVDVVTLNDSKRYSKESLAGFDFVMAVVILIRGHEESQTKSRRLKAAWEGKREKGGLLTRSVPGWIDARDGKPKLYPDRAKIVKRIFTEFVNGAGKVSIAHRLNAERVPCFGKPRKTSKRATWHASYIQRILRSSTVIGEMVPHTESHEGGKMTRTPTAPKVGYFPAAISRDLWDRAQTMLTTSGAKKQPAKGEIKSILAGLAKCPACGGSMTRVMKGERSRPTLVCASAKIGGDCKYVSVPLALIEAAFVRNAKMPIPRADNSIEQAIKEADAALDATLDSIETLLDQIERKPSLALRKRLDAHEAAGDRIRKNLADLQARAVETDSLLVRRRAARLKAALLTVPLNIGAANTALRETLTRVTVDYGARMLRLEWRHDGVTDIPYGFEDLGPLKVTP